MWRMGWRPPRTIGSRSSGRAWALRARAAPDVLWRRRMHILSIETAHGRRVAAGLAALGAFALAPPAGATQIIFPPPGSNSFIELYETDSGQSVCSLVCAFASSASPSVTIPNFSASNGPVFLNATGSVSPTAIHSLVSGNVGVEYDLATNSTYTVHGGTGPFAITAHLD